MIVLQGDEMLFISAELQAFVDRCYNDQIVGRRTDLLLLAFSYAICRELSPAENVKRQELARAYGLDGTGKVAFCAVAHWHRVHLKLPALQDQKELRDFISLLAISGLRELQARWHDKERSQIQEDILQLSAAHNLVGETQLS